jgi:uncharacterized membrane protein YvlD (DUF360 family)
MRGRLVAHAVRVLLAYVAAAFACSSVTAIILGALILLSGNVAAQSLGDLSEFLLAVVTIGFFYVVYHGFHFWLLTVSIAEFGNLRSKYWFACMGLVDASSFVAINYNGMRPMSEGPFLISILSGGVAGGLTYWKLAGKHSGKWKTPPTLVASDSVSEGAKA